MSSELVPAGSAEVENSIDRGDSSAEISSLARELARGYVELVESYRSCCGLPLHEAEAKASASMDAAVREDLVTAPADQLSWWRLSQLIAQDPEAGYRVWMRINDEAVQELASGHRAARSIEHDSRPWERAQFLALRAAFREEWQPRGGIEDALIDAMAQAYTGYLTWLERLDIHATGEARVEDHHLKERGYYLTPRLTTAQTIEQSAAMADRFHKMFLRSLRALRDLRRYGGPVVVQQAGQVNLGHGVQHVNPAAAAAEVQCRESGV